LAPIVEINKDDENGVSSHTTHFNSKVLLKIMSMISM